jgi:hypothetical protein
MPKLRHTAEGGGSPKTWDFPCDVLEICFGKNFEFKADHRILYLMASFEKKWDNFERSLGNTWETMAILPRFIQNCVEWALCFGSYCRVAVGIRIFRTQMIVLPMRWYISSHHSCQSSCSLQDVGSAGSFVQGLCSSMFFFSLVFSLESCILVLWLAGRSLQPHTVAKDACNSYCPICLILRTDGTCCGAVFGSCSSSSEAEWRCACGSSLESLAGEQEGHVTNTPTKAFCSPIHAVNGLWMACEWLVNGYLPCHGMRLRVA